ncbi:MAG: hypothetical protein A3A97_01605 [Candidatus Terrybacteria bacterium RIFCSPLOWO2_01_FULL_40_23]|uniref:Nudix hydrolase domain-containing protein n=1 Tax=Candidatus Terrybacteria bacterium RIFCSPLOWO2_01_FULL_40_23 TaxID=1802366 RepID=A0A1G2PSP0_9BACT|nr:MAG: hypothetical protein A3A97_01605 [Candidatus Terrybacteria bacterium RIFCSPLOWO2_01_FULL_40_23]
MSKTVCDHTSVGIIVTREEALRSQILLIKSTKPPYEWTLPSGHADLVKLNPTEKEFKSAARRELKEKTGLRAIQLYMIHQERTVRSCGRMNDNYHVWRIYASVYLGKIDRNKEEAQDVAWFTRAELEEHVWFTTRHQEGEVSEEEWLDNPGLEPIWCNELDIFKLFDDAEKIFPLRP